MYTQPIPLSLFSPTHSPEIEKLVHETHGLISYLSAKGGPDPSDYLMLDTLLRCFSGDKGKSILSDDQLQRIRGAFGEALSPETIQGWAYHKPLGYPGDFQIIEKIYTYYTSSNPHLAKWDQSAASIPTACRRCARPSTKRRRARHNRECCATWPSSRAKSGRRPRARRRRSATPWSNRR